MQQFKILFYPQRAFSIIEVMIGIFIFSLWLVAIYALLISSLKLSDYNKHAIIASQLAVEQIELVRNIRDTNYKLTRRWDMIGWDTLSSYSGSYLKIENNLTTAWVDITKISSFWEGIWELDRKMQSYKICITPSWIYTYDCVTSWNKSTPYYKYLFLEEIEADKLRLTSKVIWYARGYHEFDIKTLITDWRRL